MTNTVMIYLTVAIALLTISSAAAADSPAPAGTKYTNHTVGGSDGWFFNATSNKTSGDYSTWADSETFNLGDYLIFNTNSNQTVIQTTNKTSYQSCSVEDDTNQFYGGNVEYNQPATVSVPLTTMGPNYYFSDASDGEQCRHGLAFMITVGRGLGLPESLNQPPPPVYVEPPTETPPAVVTPTTPEDTTGAGVAVKACWLVSCLVVFVGGVVLM